MILDRENKYNFILCCKPFASFVRCAIYNIVIETFDTLSCPDKNFNIYLHFLLFASHPLNGWIWFGEGLRGYDNWQRSAASDFQAEWAWGNGQSIEVSGRNNTKVRG